MTIIRSLLMVLLLAPALSLPAASQTAAVHIANGDRAYASLDGQSALAHYEKAIAADPSSYEAHWKASRSAVDIGSYHADASRRGSLFQSAEQYARRSIALKPNDAEGHFSLARALGKTALAQSTRGRIRYATEIRARALECLRIDPRHAGCLHVMGAWNAEVMRLNSVARMVAKNVLGGRVFGQASWKDAVRYMEASVANEPNRIVHRVDLAEIYLDVKQRDKAVAELEAALRLPVDDVNDRIYKEQAKTALSRIR